MASWEIFHNARSVDGEHVAACKSQTEHTTSAHTNMGFSLTFVYEGEPAVL